VAAASLVRLKRSGQVRYTCINRFKSFQSSSAAVVKHHLALLQTRSLRRVFFYVLRCRKSMWRQFVQRAQHGALIAAY
jgi:hypothetical protein